MAKRRGRGEGGIYWHDGRQRYIGTVTIGYRPNGKRIVRSCSGKTKDEVRDKLAELHQDKTHGTTAYDAVYTVGHAVREWLKNGLGSQDKATIDKLTSLAETHILEIGYFSKQRLEKLYQNPNRVDAWLKDRAEHLSTSSLQAVVGALRRAITFAIRRRKARHNVMDLCDVPRGKKKGRPSKSLNLAQATELLKVAEADQSTIGNYTIVSLLTGARTEEIRVLEWSLTDPKGDPADEPPKPPTIAVWRSVRTHGDTKTKKSRRTIALPQRATEAIVRQRTHQERQRQHAGSRWQDNDLVFASETGRRLDAANVRRGMRRLLEKISDIDPAKWTPRELRHSFVSILSDDGTPVETISLLVGHKDTNVTETVYRHQLRPVVQHGAEAMDMIFQNDEQSEEPDQQSGT